MRASRPSTCLESLSGGLTRWVGLLAIAMLPFSAACIAQTSTSEEGLDHASASAKDDIKGATAPLPGKGPSPNNPGPDQGPLPSPWDPAPGNSGGNGDQASNPVPSPWTEQGQSTSGTTVNEQASGQPAGQPSGKPPSGTTE